MDLFGIPTGTPARTVGWYHLAVLATATGMFIGTLRLQLAGYSNGQIITNALVLGIATAGLRYCWPTMRPVGDGPTGKPEDC